MRSPHVRFVRLLRASIVVASALLGSESHAAPPLRAAGEAPPPGLSAPESSVEEHAPLDAGPSPRIVSALTSVSRHPDGLAYTTRFVVSLEDAAHFRGGYIRLAHALPAGAALVDTPNVKARVVDGDIVGVDLAPEALVDRAVTVRVLQPLPPSGRFFLGAPIAEGHMVQIVDGALVREQLHLDDGIFERHVGFTGTRSVDEAARMEARRLTGYTVRLTGTPIYLRGDDLHGAPQVSATLVSDRARLRSTYIVVAGVFVMLAIGLVLAARRLSRAASLERADAILASACEEAG